jgi:hypothetical protein
MDTDADTDSEMDTDMDIDIDSNASMDNFNRAFVIKKRTKNIESVKFLYINISEISVLPLSSLNGN